MGLMDKFKNLFTDEEIVDEEDENESIEIKEIKKEVYCFDAFFNYRIII